VPKEVIYKRFEIKKQVHDLNDSKRHNRRKYDVEKLYEEYSASFESKEGKNNDEELLMIFLKYL
jgi:hypothetical protein